MLSDSPLVKEYPAPWKSVSQSVSITQCRCDRCHL